jgi:hypothetical protein
MQQTNRLKPFFENIAFEREDNTMVWRKWVKI